MSSTRNVGHYHIQQCLVEGSYSMHSSSAKLKGTTSQSENQTAFVCGTCWNSLGDIGQAQRVQPQLSAFMTLGHQAGARARATPPRALRCLHDDLGHDQTKP